MASKTRSTRTRKPAVKKFVPNPKGNTGPAYTPKQVAQGVRLFKAGKLTNREIAAKVGVGSPAYFAKTVRATVAA